MERKRQRNKLDSDQRQVTLYYIYPDTCGQLMKKHYRLNPDMDGMMIFFPSDMNHLVYPHFTTDEWRISIAGDIALNSYEITTQINHEFPDPKVKNV